MTVASILRHRRRHHFTVLPNGALRDKQLSFRARGLLGYLLSLPDGSPVDARLLVSEGSEGRDAIRAAFRELVDVGYARRWTSQMPNGQWITLTEVGDVPENPASVPGPEYPASVDQAMENEELQDEETKAASSHRTGNPNEDVHNASDNGVAASPQSGGDPGPDEPASHDCASGWLYDAEGDVYPCPTCRPLQHRDAVAPGASTGTRRRDLD